MEHREVSKLKTNPLNPRGEIVHDVSLRELAMSIKAQGVLQPILITSDGTIIAGHRRVAAAKIVDVSEVPVIVRDLTEAAQLQVMLVENLQRSDLTLMQTARAYRELSQRGLSADLIARAIGVTKRSVSEHLMVFQLPSELVPYYENGSLSLRTIPRLLTLKPDEQLHVGRLAGEEKWGEIKVSGFIHRLQNPERKQDRTRATIKERIFERIEDGCYSVESIRRCSECGHAFLSLTAEEAQEYINTLVAEGRVEWRKQGGRKDDQKGDLPSICVPVDLPSGEGFEIAREKTVWSEEAWS